jgi:hypothetical protein
MDIGEIVQDAIKALNDNSGFTMVIVTLVYTVVTLAIVVEARRARLLTGEAAVLYRASPWPKAHMYLAVRVENYGPAVARDLTFTYWLTRADGGRVPDSAGTLHETMFPIGLPREALPHDPAGPQAQTREQLAAAGLRVNAEWSWRDGCGRLHRNTDSREISQIVTDYRDSRVLVEHFPLDSLPDIEKHLDGISDSLAQIAKGLGKR